MTKLCVEHLGFTFLAHTVCVPCCWCPVFTPYFSPYSAESALMPSPNSLISTARVITWCRSCDSSIKVKRVHDIVTKRYLRAGSHRKNRCFPPIIVLGVNVQHRCWILQERAQETQWRRYVVAKQCKCTASLLPCTANCTACILESETKIMLLSGLVWRHINTYLFICLVTIYSYMPSA